MRNCGEIICDTLERLGARVVFGMPGSQNVPLYEALRASKLRAIVTTNEMAAAFAANGFYRASGEVGVLTTIPGPGFTFALPGLSEAHLDSSALLMITPSSGDGSTRLFQHQHIDMRAMVAPITKEFIRVDQIDDLADAVARGYQLAAAGGPGPVMLEFNSRLFGEQTGRQATIAAPHQPPVDSVTLAAIAEALSRGKRIALFVGQGGQQCPDRIKLLADRLGALVLTTNSGRGVVSEQHSHSLYYDYSYGGGETINQLIDACDFVLALGCKFSHNGSGGFVLRIAREKLIHVDSAATVLNANYPARWSIQADVGTFIQTLLPALTRSETVSAWSEPEIANWRSRIQSEQMSRLKVVPSVGATNPMTGRQLFDQLREVLPDNCCVVTDSGFHQVLTRMFYSVRSPRGLITPADFQSMGFGLPAAIGAKAAAPNRPVVVVIGDGGMAISGLELLTAIREQINLTVVIFNDGYLNLIRLRQIDRGSEDSSTSLRNPDFSLLAAAVGANYFSSEQGVGESLRACLNTPGVNILELFLSDPPGMGRRKIEGVLRRQLRTVTKTGFLSRLRNLLH